MKVRSRKSCDFTAKTEVWTVEPAAIDQIFRVTVTAPQNPIPPGSTVCGLVGVDGDLVAGALVSAVNGMGLSGEAPPTVVVSIGYPLDTQTSWLSLRTRELTPAAFPEFDAWTAAMWRETVPASGGADAFLSFIIDELVPEVQSAFGVAPSEWTLTGASLGGLFTVYALLSRPGAFRRYNAVSPAVWFKRPSLFDAARAFTADPHPLSAAIYLSAGEFESGEHVRAQMARLPEDARVVFETTFSGIPDMIEDARDMAAILASKNGVRATVKIFENESHNSVFGVAQSQGLRWLHQQA